MYVCRPEEGTRCGCWELNSGPLEEQAMLLTTEPSLQTLLFFLPAFSSVFPAYLSSALLQVHFWGLFTSTSLHCHLCMVYPEGAPR